MKTAEFGPAGTAGLTDYEILRQKNISRNAKLLEDLNLKHEFAAMLPLPDTPKEKQVKTKKKARRSSITPPPRRSRRSIRGQKENSGSPDGEAGVGLFEDDEPAAGQYHKVVGISCHFCRQKKLCKLDDCPRCSKLDEMAECTGKSVCSACKGPDGVFCEMCLRSRYGLTLDEARAESWMCFHCFEKANPEAGWICNSSFCMQKRGLACTGIAIHDAKKSGFASVGHQIQAQIKSGVMRPLPLGSELPKPSSGGGGGGKKRRRSH